MYMEHANVVFHLDLTCLREYEIRTLHDSQLLSASIIRVKSNLYKFLKNISPTSAISIILKNIYI